MFCNVSHQWDSEDAYCQNCGVRKHHEPDESGFDSSNDLWDGDAA